MDDTAIVTEKFCNERHRNTETALSNMNKTMERNWSVIDDLRESMQKQGTKIAMIIGGIIVVANALSMIVVILTR